MRRLPQQLRSPAHLGPRHRMAAHARPLHDHDRRQGLLLRSAANSTTTHTDSHTATRGAVLPQNDSSAPSTSTMLNDPTPVASRERYEEDATKPLTAPAPAFSYDA